MKTWSNGARKRLVEIQDFNRPGYTIEAGRGVNPLPISQFDEIYKDNLGILTLGALVT